MKSLIALMFSTIIFFSGCEKKDETKSTIESSSKSTIIDIGAIVPLSGTNATYGNSLKKGFETAIHEEQNFEILYEDSKALPKEGINAINKLIKQDKVNFIVGDATSGVTLSIVPFAEKNKVILLAPIATADSIKDSGDYIFRNAPRNEKQAIKAVDFIVNDLKKKKIAIFNKNSDYGVNLAKKFKDKLLSLKITPIYEDSYQNNQKDFKNNLIKMKELNIEAIYLPGNYEETAVILKQAKELGVNAIFVGADGSYSDKLIEIAGEASENSYYTMMTISKDNNMYKNFEKEFMNKYGEKPNVFSAYGYEAVKILIEAIKKVGNDSNKVKDYLYNNEFDSLTGKLRFDKDGEVIRDYGILKVENGEFIQI